MNSPSSIQRVIRDVIDLCELQMQLLSVDSQAAKRKLTGALACGAAAATLAGAALTVLLVGGGLLLGETTSLSPAGGLLVSGGLTFAVVVLLLILALTAVRSAAAAMNETKSEFAENLRWLKATLISPEASARNRMRSESFPDHELHDEPRSPENDFHPRPVSPLYQR